MAVTEVLLVLATFYQFMPSSAQVPFLGVCPEVKTMPQFSATKFRGKWYEAERYFSVFEFAGKCVNSNYTDGFDNAMNVISRQTSSLTGIHSTIEGEVHINEKEPSKLNVKFPYLPLSIDAPYWILDTDYENYAVVWSCTNFGIFSARSAWILTRARNPTLEVMEKAYGIIDKNAISKAYFIRTDQKNCPDDY